jgi:hypothetical protein
MGALVLAGCTASTSGIPCSNVGNCPSGYACVNDTCVLGAFDTTIPCPNPPGSTLYVSSSAGANGNGSMLCPLQTISAALTKAGHPTSTFTIDVLAGTYAAPAETFPLVVPANVQVLGLGSSADAVVVDGAGTVTLPTGGNASLTVHLMGTLGNLQVESTHTAADAIVAATNGGPHLKGVDVAGGGDAVIVMAVDGTTLTIDGGSDIHGALVDGVAIMPVAKAIPIVNITNSSIHDNQSDGIDAMVGTVSVGPTASAPMTCTSPSCLTNSVCGCLGQVGPGAVSIYCNHRFGIESAVPVTAEYNHWQNASPSCGAAGSDVSSCLVDSCCAQAATTQTCG